MHTPRASFGPVNICSAGKKHRRQRRITASADGTRAAHCPPRGDLGLSAVGQLRNRLDDLFGKSARTFCRYLHRGPSRTCPSFVPRFVPSRPRSLLIRVEVQLPEGPISAPGTERTYRGKLAHVRFEGAKRA